MAEISPPLIQEAMDLLRLGKNGYELDSYIQSSILRPVETGFTHFDRIRVYENLLAEGVLYVKDGKFWTVSGNIPDWIFDALAGGFFDPEAIAEQVAETPEHRKKFDSELLARIGLKGEEVFVDELAELLPESAVISHVSLLDDSLGYDVRVELDDREPMYFEVKTTVRTTKKFNFYFSKNEFEVAKMLGKNWRFAFVNLHDGQGKVLGEAFLNQFLGMLPEDKSSKFTWASVSCSIGYQEISNLTV